jgi:hypothetical protein
VHTAFRKPPGQADPSRFLALDVPDIWQQEAVRCLKEGRDVIVDAPTGAGKTRVFELFLRTTEAARLGQAVFTVPTRALANDKWREWKTLGREVGISTGDIAENLTAPVIVATLETQRERILAGEAPGFLVLDEYQMIADPHRGLNYELAMALPETSTRLLLLSGSVANPGDIAEWLRRLGRNVDVVSSRTRPVPLEEIPVENLPPPPGGITGFWPRVAASARHAGLTPLLIFAPRRADAESMARRIAAALPQPSPVGLTREEEEKAGRDLARLLRKRVAYHHSGLTYAARSEFVERLGKAGELDVIVATTGLAAGINFSVRSVAISSTTYGDARFQRELRPDELLQMFGRAGRRGLDECGFALVASGTPRLADASPRRLKRLDRIDWPTLLRVMEAAAERGDHPLEAATALCARLFGTRLAGPLDVPASATPTSSEKMFAARPLEFLAEDGEWHPHRTAEKSLRPLSDCIAWHRQRWVPATATPAALKVFPPGRPCRIPSGPHAGYGKEFPLAGMRDDGRFEPVAAVRRRLGLARGEAFERSGVERDILPLLAADWAPATPCDTVVHGGVLMARTGLGKVEVDAIRSPTGAWLFQPPTRRMEASTKPSSGTFDPPRGSAARAWFQLGLVDGFGNPTARGRVFSRFQNGEGLVIAAALEDPTYPVESLVLHLANIRGGPRFRDFADGPSLRLAAAAREAYGHVDHEGHLEAGLCPGYGEGTSEALQRWFARGAREVARESELVARGDLERALLEWKSLLRHIAGASHPGTARWEEFSAAATACLRRNPKEVFTDADMLFGAVGSGPA